MILEGVLRCENSFFEEQESNPVSYIGYYEDMIYG